MNKVINRHLRALTFDNLSLDYYRASLPIVQRIINSNEIPMKVTERLEHTKFLPDSFVLVHYRNGLPPTCFHTHWRGPMKVIKGFNSRYTPLYITTGKETDFHMSDMRPFVFDSAVIDSEDIARRDHMEYFIDEILEHRGNLKKKTEIEFLISWLCFSVDLGFSWK